MSKTKVGTFGFRGVPHAAERKSYGSEGKELMKFRMHEKAYLQTFSTTVMEQVELASANNTVLWVFGDIVEAPGYGDNSDKIYTNYDATAAMVDIKSVKEASQDTSKTDGLPF